MKVGHFVFRATSALDRGQLKSKGGWKLSMHICADYATIGTDFSHCCFCESAQCQRSSRRLVSRINSSLPLTNKEKTFGIMEQSESTVESTDLLNIQRPLQTSEQAQGNLLQNHTGITEKIIRIKSCAQMQDLSKQSHQNNIL